MQRVFTLILSAILYLTGAVAVAAPGDPAIDDRPLKEALSLPDWFKLSFLDIQDDINEATRGRRGLIIYFGQSYCPYCRAHLENNWGRKDIVAYTRANFDVIAINVRGNSSVIDIGGNEYSEKQFAARYKANFTPTTLFFDDSGKQALKLSGYRKPYQFLAALEYVADKHHRNETFREYLARAEQAESFGQDSLNDNDIFKSPPFDLAKLAKQAPLAVFFEERRCHACDVLHGGPLARPAILEVFKQLNTVQLDMWSETPVVTPQGKNTTAKKWADELALNYAPTIIFYDESGQEIIRVDSVVGFLRLKNVLKYINTRAYRTQPSYQLWRSEVLYKKMNP
ncbi:MAG: thioredoxin fold domain-containing protein [Thioalkalispiraceae bacterium]|jgi:thioredoxin-related protein